MYETKCGYIKLYRGLLDWRWYNSPNSLRLYLHCLLNVYYQETQRLDMKIPAGSFETSYGKLARELKLTEKQIRTALSNLKKTGDVAVRATRKCSIITVIGFVESQREVIPYGTIKSEKSQYEGSKRSTNKEYKNKIKEKKRCGI